MKKTLLALLCVGLVTGVALAQPGQRRGPGGPDGPRPQQPLKVEQETQKPDQDAQKDAPQIARPRLRARQDAPAEPRKDVDAAPGPRAIQPGPWQQRPLWAQPDGRRGQAGPQGLAPGQDRPRQRQAASQAQRDVRPRARRDNRPAAQARQNRPSRQAPAWGPQARTPGQARGAMRGFARGWRAPMNRAWAPGIQRGAAGQARPWAFGRGFGLFGQQNPQAPAWQCPRVPPRQGFGQGLRQGRAGWNRQGRGQDNWQGPAVRRGPQANRPGRGFAPGRGRGQGRTARPLPGFGPFCPWQP